MATQEEKQQHQREARALLEDSGRRIQLQRAKTAEDWDHR